MKKKIIKSIIFLTILGLLFNTGLITNNSKVKAQEETDCAGVNNPISPDFWNPRCNIKQGQENVNKAAGAAAEKVASGLANITIDVMAIIVQPLALLLLSIMSLITQLAGMGLNWAMQHTIVDMAANFGHINGLVDTWKAVRDVANMGFIFILLYTSIKMILGSGGDVYRIIKNIIIAAILINFSFFITRVIIDLANVLAVTFYSAIVPGGVDAVKTGLSAVYVEMMGLTTLWKGVGAIDAKQIATIGIMGSIVLLIAAFSFFAITIMLLIRYVVLILVMVLSPIAFVASVLPGLNGPAHKWWDALYGQAFFAPVYLFLSWLSIKILRGITSGGNWSETLTSASMNKNVYQQGAIELFISFGIIIVFMIASLIIAKQFADKAGSQVSKLTGNVMGFAGSATFGLAGYGARRTLGSYGRSVADNDKLKDMAANKDGKYSTAASMRARLNLKAGQKLAGSTFDARAATAMGALSKNTGISFGKPMGKGGYDDWNKKKAEDQEKFIKSISEPSDIQKDQAKARNEAARKEHESVLLEEREARVKAEQEVNRTLTKPTDKLQEIDENIMRAESVVNSKLDIPESQRQEAKEKAKQLTEERATVVKKYEEEKERRVSQILAGTNIKQRVEEANAKRETAQAENERINGIDKDEKKKKKDNLDKQRDKELANDPDIKKKNELAKDIDKLDEQIAKATGEERTRLEAEKRGKEKELELAKDTAKIKEDTIRLQYDKQKRDIDNFKSVAEERKEARIAAKEDPGRISPDRVFFIGVRSRASQQAVANLRKGKKPVRDQLEELLRDQGDIPKKAEEAPEATEAEADSEKKP